MNQVGGSQIRATVPGSRSALLQTRSLPEPRLLYVVDDDELFRDALGGLLHLHGFRVRGCKDGVEALRRLSRGALPAAIILDLHMPDMSGREFRQQQKLTPRIAEIPVIGVSGDNSPAARSLDVEAFLPKPVPADKLLGALHEVGCARALPSQRAPHWAAEPVVDPAAAAAEAFTTCQRVQEALMRCELDLLTCGYRGPVARWVWWPTSRRVVWSHDYARILGVPEGTHTPSCEALWNSVHQEDRASLSARFDSAVRGRCSFEHSFRIVRADRSVCAVVVTARAVLDELGRPTHYAGNVRLCSLA